MRTHPLTAIAAAAVACVASLLLAPQTHAQSSACEQLKAKLSARIESSIRSFTLEAVTAGTPLPPGAKAIGTCDGGAYKILLLRSGSASSVAATARPLPIANPAPAASSVVPVQVQAKVQVQAQVQMHAPESPSPRASAPESDVDARTSTAVRAVKAIPAAPAAPSALTSSTASEAAQTNGLPLSNRAPELVRQYWHVCAAIVLTLLAATVWAWLRHRRSLDTAGLPRGPKIRML